MQCIHVHLILCLVLHLMQCDALMTVWACGSNLGLVCSPAVLLLVLRSLNKCKYGNIEKIVKQY